MVPDGLILKARLIWNKWWFNYHQRRWVGYMAASRESGTVDHYKLLKMEGKMEERYEAYVALAHRVLDGKEIT